MGCFLFEIALTQHKVKEITPEKVIPAATPKAERVQRMIHLNMLSMSGIAALIEEFQVRQESSTPKRWRVCFWSDDPHNIMGLRTCIAAAENTANGVASGIKAFFQQYDKTASHVRADSHTSCGGVEYEFVHPLVMPTIEEDESSYDAIDDEVMREYDALEETTREMGGLPSLR